MFKKGNNDLIVNKNNCNITAESVTYTTNQEFFSSLQKRKTDNLKDFEKEKRLAQSLLDKERVKKNIYKGKDTPLFDAVRKGDKALIEKLLSEGWDINHKGVNGLTPICLAIIHKIYLNENSERTINNIIINFLIEKGARVEYCCLGYALTHLTFSDFERLFNMAQIAQEQLKNLFKVAFISNYEKAMHFIASHIEGKCPEAVNISDGAKPLAYRYIKGSRVILNLLIDKGLNFKEFANDGSTILHTAAKMKKLDIIELALKRHITINTLDRDKNSLLTYAIINNLYDSDFCEIVKFFIRNKINLDLVNKSGSTALIEVIEHTLPDKEDKSLEIIKLLISARADITICNDEGYNALMLATKLGYKKIKETLENRGLDFKTRFLSQPPEIMYETAICSADESLLDYLPLEKLNTIRFGCYSALGLAYEKFEKEQTSQRLTMVRKLVDIGAKFNSYEGFTIARCSYVFKNCEDLTIKLLELGADFIYKPIISYEYNEYERKSLILYAVLEGKVQLFNYLIKRCKVFTYSQYGLWLLSLAIANGQRTIANDLISLMDFKKCYQDLEKNCAQNQKEQFEFLPLDKKEKPTLYYCDPLLTAIKEREEDFVERLLNLYVDNVGIKLDKYLQEIERIKSNSICAKISIQKEFNKIMFDSRVVGSTFISACVRFDYTLAQQLLDSGVDINTTQGYNTNAVNYIVMNYCKEESESKKNKQIKMLKWLKEKGADFNLKDSEGVGAMFLALHYKKNELADLLLSLGCSSTSEKDKISATFELYEIVKKDEVGIGEITRLISKGADINFTGYADPTHPSILISALKQKNYHILATLIAAGVDTGITDSKGFNFFDYIMKSHAWDAKQIFSQLKPYINKFSPLVLISLASAHNNTTYALELMKELIKAGFDINVTNSKGDTPLYNACISYNPDGVKLLLEQGANVNTIHNDYEHEIAVEFYTSDSTIVHNSLTPLMAAALQIHDNTKAIKNLIKYGADVNATDNKNNNVLTLLLDPKCHICINCCATNYEQITNKPRPDSGFHGCYRQVSLLIEAGVDLDHENIYGNSARKLILESEDEELIKLLEQTKN